MHTGCFINVEEVALMTVGSIRLLGAKNDTNGGRRYQKKHKKERTYTNQQKNNDT